MKIKRFDFVLLLFLISLLPACSLETIKEPSIIRSTIQVEKDSLKSIHETKVPDKIETKPIITSINSVKQNNENTISERASVTTTSSTNPDIQESQSQEVFLGQWIIKKQLAYGPVGTYSSDDIKNIIGKKMSFSKEKASCFGDEVSYLNDVAENPVYKKTAISKSQFESENRVTFEKLGIVSTSVIEVNASDLNDNGCCFLIKDKNSLILIGGGVYLELERK